MVNQGSQFGHCIITSVCQFVRVHCHHFVDHLERMRPRFVRFTDWTWEQALKRWTSSICLYEVQRLLTRLENYELLKSGMWRELEQWDTRNERKWRPKPLFDEQSLHWRATSLTFLELLAFLNRGLRIENGKMALCCNYVKALILNCTKRYELVPKVTNERYQGHQFGPQFQSVL